MNVPSLSFVTATKAPVGVAIVRYNNKLSRMYRCDTNSYQFTAGQFVKADARVEDVSPDGRYVLYTATSYAKYETYLAVSHVGFFTALAFLPFEPSNRSEVRARFQSDSEISITAYGLGRYEELNEGLWRIEPGCPFAFTFDRSLRSGRWLPRRHTHHPGFLPEGNRLLRVDADEAIATFEREAFEEIPPPDWARRW